MSGVDRRDFLRTTTLAGVGLALGSSDALAAVPAHAATRSAPQEPELFRAPPMETVRVAFVGVGHQGSSHVANFLRIDGVEITAICDIAPDKVAAAQKVVTDAGRALPAAYDRGPRDYVRLCESDDVDLVFTATPWNLHAPVCLAAMENGKHAATEVPMAPTIDELWQLVETAERTRRHCVMMENCCYDRTEMMILNMVRQNVFGELLHAECGYLHDLRELKLTDFYEGRWRVEHSIRRNGDLYPTHGLGPVAQWLDVNRGNQFDYVVSMASPGRGLNRWAAEHIGPDSPEARQQYALGDVVNTLIRTRRGQTVLLTHDTNSPRPYSRRILLQGTQGLVRKYPDERIHIEGRSAAHRWDELRSYREEYDHPIWRALEERSRGAGHGGMDFIEDYRLVQCLRAGEPMDMDVYDGAAWSAISELSERSIAQRSAPQDVPDFTRGAWRGRPPLGIVQG
ncbi:MAG TPA: Gfo/Idh/MocA family oxidoreductase [Longimicrobiales bacterium]|nr:Gfo/Idh/MocA family oxidoreductase [Longimicrobiales bacterium]